MDLFGFQVWTTLSRGWAFIAATFIILVPLIQEVHAIWRQHNLNLKEQNKNDTTNMNGHEGNGDQNHSTKAGGSKRGNLTCFFHINVFMDILQGNCPECAMV